MLQLNLSDAEIQRLNYERYHYPCPTVQKRLTAVYYKASFQLSNSRTAELTDLSRNTVSRWIRAYKEGGTEALYLHIYGANKSELEHSAPDIMTSFTESPPRNSKEAVARIEQLTGISRSPTQVRAFMKRHGFHYIKTGHIPAKADTQQQRQWVEEKLQPAIKAAQEGKAHLLFVDAAHFILQPFVCALWCVTRLFIKAASGRNRINVLGAVHAITQEVITLTNTTYISADTIVVFLKKIRKRFGDLPVFIVLDNARYQHCQLVKNTAEDLKITLLFLPPYSPNLNIIERLWKFTKKTILYARYYDTADKFHLAIIEHFRTINKKHAPELKKILTLKFQFFDEQNAQFCSV